MCEFCHFFYDFVVVVVASFIHKLKPLYLSINYYFKSFPRPMRCFPFSFLSFRFYFGSSMYSKTINEHLKERKKKEASYTLCCICILLQNLYLFNRQFVTYFSIRSSLFSTTMPCTESKRENSIVIMIFLCLITCAKKNEWKKKRGEIA